MKNYNNAKADNVHPPRGAYFFISLENRIKVMFYYLLFIQNISDLTSARLMADYYFVVSFNVLTKTHH